ncbi:MAG: bifunctional 2-keto-4-hydroxyglutarate aldolase/2-keto-3-deoxy-6-phosphogluconate aldolase [Clostridiales bacterium]
MSKNEIITKIKDNGLVAVIRADTTEKALNLADACAKAGIGAVEVTFTVAGAEGVIRELCSRKYDNDILIGAGTVLDSETARVAILAGAKYLVSPAFNLDTAKLCNRYQVPYMPGAMTPKEAIECMEAGADIIKIFPGELFGPKIIKAIKGPLPQASLMPTGGVSLDNVDQWIKAGSCAVGVGGNLTKVAAKGDYNALVDTGKEFLKRIKKARES